MILFYMQQMTPIYVIVFCNSENDEKFNGFEVVFNKKNRF